jgi:hypothetical protein
MAEKNNPAEKGGNGPGASKKDPTPPAPPEDPKGPDDGKKARKVRVICEGTLGPLLLEKGATTSDERYIALLDTPSGRKKIEAVK